MYNYDPYQFPEKLILLVIKNTLKGRALPIYSDGNLLVLIVIKWVYMKCFTNNMLDTSESI